MEFAGIVSQVDSYYSARLRQHGPTPRGVDWNSPESQQLRFRQLLQVCDPTQSFSVTDFGCGYGALADYLAGQGLSFQYTGYDISAAMVQKARELHAGRDNCAFTSDER